MSAPAQQFTVRSDYVHALACACQRFVGSILLLEPSAFVSAARRLLRETPVAESPAEALVTWNRLTETIAHGAAAHHVWFHRCLDASPCDFFPELVPSPDSFARDRVFSLLDGWTGTIAGRFESAHAWPAAIKAAGLLQARVSEPWYIEELAKAVGASSATLERSFKRIYGLSAQQYHSLLRLRMAALAIRAGDRSIEGVVLEIGCRSPKDLYRAFRHVTSMTLAGVRRLTDTEFSSLMACRLELPIPRPPLKTDQDPHGRSSVSQRRR